MRKILIYNNGDLKNRTAKNNNSMDTPTYPQLKTKKLKKEDSSGLNCRYKTANCFSQTNLPNISLTNKLSCVGVEIQNLKCPNAIYEIFNMGLTK